MHEEGKKHLIGFVALLLQKSKCSMMQIIPCVQISAN